MTRSTAFREQLAATEPPPEPETPLKTAQVAALLGIHPNTVKRLGNEGHLSFFRVTTRGDRRYDPAEVRAFLARMQKRFEKQPVASLPLEKA